MIVQKLIQLRASIARPRTQLELRRRWVETADERCPLACTWSALPAESAAQDDDDWLRWPAFSRPRKKAGFPLFIHPAFADLS